MTDNIAIRSIRWDITNKCNLSCLHCYTTIEESRELNYSQVLEIIEKLRPFGLNEINLSGREPTLRKDLLDIVEWCRNKFLRVNITTNGVTFTTFEFEKLLNSKLNMLVFSFDGTTAISHDKIRGNGCFNKTIENIKHCVKYVKEKEINTRIGVSFTLQKFNEVECAGIVELCNFLQIDFLGINPVSFCGSASMRKSELYLPPTNILSCWENICKLYKEISPNYDIYLGTFPMEAKFLNTKYGLSFPVIHTGCSAGKTIYINPDGKALPCYMLPSIASEVPDLKKYLNFWDILSESPEKGFQKFEPFILFAAEYSPKNNRGCASCSDLEVCKRCPLIAILDPDSITRCQLARNLLNNLNSDINQNTVPIIKDYINWELNDKILSMVIRKDGYLSDKKIELSPEAKDIWMEITKGISVSHIESNLKRKGTKIDEIELRENIKEVIDYFWKEGIIQVVNSNAKADPV